MRNEIVKHFDTQCEACDEKRAFFQLTLSGPDGVVYDMVRVCEDCAGVMPGEQGGGIVIDGQRVRLGGTYDFRLNLPKFGW